MIDIHSFVAEAAPGPHLLVLGGVHGSEPCGSLALARILALFANGELAPKRGRVTFVPVCNPVAATRRARFVERNLNRYLVPHHPPETYEDKIGNILCPLLESCDALLDLHSNFGGGAPFLTMASNASEAERAFAASLGINDILSGWQEAYAATGRASQKQEAASDERKDSTEESKDSTEESTGTTEYARRFGAIALTLECGQHEDPASAEIAFQATRRALAHFGMSGDAPPQTDARFLRFTHVFYKDKPGRFARPFKSMDPVCQGETLAAFDDGTRLAAPTAGVVVFPHESSPLGEEWLYLAVPETP